MANAFLLSKKYIDKQQIVRDIEEVGKELGCRIEREDLFLDELSDVDLYFDVDGDFFMLDFGVIDEKNFPEDRIIIDSMDYYIAVSINCGSSTDHYLGLFLKKFMPLYPDMLFSDDSCKIFHTKSDVVDGKVKWLEEE